MHRPHPHPILLAAVAALAAAHEALAAHRGALLRRQLRAVVGSASSSGGGARDEPLLLGGPGGGGGGTLTQEQRAGHALLYALNMASGYLLMLAVMTYNTGILLATVASLGVAHFIFWQPGDAGGARHAGC